MKRFTPKPTFEERIATNSQKERVDNSKLLAGAPMYYYCRLCGNEMVLPEAHIEASPRYCGDCVDEGRAMDSYTPTPRVQDNK